MDKKIRNKLKNSIFISGMHRSGTSWVSEILSTAGSYVLKDEVSRIREEVSLISNYWYDQKSWIK